MTQESNTHRIDQIIRNWFWQPFGSPYEAAKEILKLFGKRPNLLHVCTISQLLTRSERPWEAAEAILHIVNIAGNKRGRV